MPIHHPLDRHRGSPTGHRSRHPDPRTGESGYGNVPSYDGLSKYDVNRPGWEAIRNALYDSSAYAAAGALSLQFFQVPQGQGTTSEPVSTGVKTLADTNMLAAGSLPNNIEYLAESVEIDFQPTTPTVATAMPGVQETPSAATAIVLINDVYIFRRSGWLIFHIGSKDYLQEAPLSKFPTKTHFHVEGFASDADTTTKNLTIGQWATVSGRPYHLAPLSLRLESTQNFNINLNWGAKQVITNPARVFVRIDGVYYRRSQ
jgi:hypothetical protein